jgi:hypothetical protein
MIGNGLGFLGAGVVVAPWRQLTFELQVSHLEGQTSPPTDQNPIGWGVAPLVRAYWWPDGTIVPYAAAGGAVTRLTYRSLAWTTTGLFATAGVEWRTDDQSWRFLAGAGFRYSPAVSVSDGSGWIHEDRYLGINLELGMRYMF